MSVKFANITLFELIAKKRDHQLPRLSNELVRLEGLDSRFSQFGCTASVTGGILSVYPTPWTLNSLRPSAI
jgi:hypothetical protein